MESIKIYTGCVGRLRTYPTDLMPITICLYPRGIVAVNYGQLAPTKETFRSSNWQDLYRKQLDRLNARSIYGDIARLSKGRDVILLCFEKPGDACHRHIVAEWMESELGIEVNEFLPGGEVGRHTCVGCAPEQQTDTPAASVQLGFDW